MLRKTRGLSAELQHKRVSKVEGLAAFSPDALASIGYADQEIYLGLVIAGSAGLAYAMPIAIAISGLLAILAVSYYQVVQKFPSGGGSYEVARTTLGTVPGLVAAAALIVNYLLNVSVSLTTGVDAIASAFPQLWPHRIVLSLLLLGIGAAATGMTFVIVGTEKFLDGAWIAVILIPILVALFIQIHGRGRVETTQ